MQWKCLKNYFKYDFLGIALSRHVEEGLRRTHALKTVPNILKFKKVKSVENFKILMTFELLNSFQIFSQDTNHHNLY